MVNLASAVLDHRESISLKADSNLTYLQLVQAGGSAGGAIAKALIV